MVIALNRLMPGLAAVVASTRDARVADCVAGLVTGMVLIPQAVAFSQLAGLPPQVGLAASMLPMLVYALLGSSRVLSVGPVSVAALMVAAVLAQAQHAQGGASSLVIAAVLAAEGGVLLLLMALLRLDVLARVFSHPVLGGFTVGAAIVIVLSQIKPLLGISGSAKTGMPGVLSALDGQAWHTFLPGVIAAAALFLYANRLGVPLQAWLTKRVTAAVGLIAAKAGPMLIVFVAIVGTLLLTRNVAGSSILPWPVVGVVPSALMHLQWSWLTQVDLAFALSLLPSAAMIALVGYVESIAVAESLAQRRRESINSRQELVALGAANIAGAFSGAMPVAGGFSRTMVNFSAGARTQLATVVAVVVVSLFVAFATGLFEWLPKFALAAIIIVAVLPLLSLKEFKHLIATDWRDAVAWLATAVGVVVWGLEEGLLLGAALGLILFLVRAVRPHIAVLGRVSDSEHFRNVKRFNVKTYPSLLLVRFDDALSFLNAASLETFVARELALQPQIRHVVINAAAINHIDTSGAHALERLAVNIAETGVTLHLAEVKGPVSDYLITTGCLKHLGSTVFLSTEQAVAALVTAA